MTAGISNATRNIPEIPQQNIEESVVKSSAKLALKVGAITALVFTAVLSLTTIGLALNSMALIYTAIPVGIIAAGALVGYLHERNWHGVVLGAVATATAVVAGTVSFAIFDTISAGASIL